MTDPSRYPDTEDDTGVGPDRGVAASTPRWSVLGICIAVVVILVIVVFVVLHLTGTVGPGSK